MSVECPECHNEYEKSGLYGHLRFKHMLSGEELERKYRKAIGEGEQSEQREPAEQQPHEEGQTVGANAADLLPGQEEQPEPEGETKRSERNGQQQRRPIRHRAEQDREAEARRELEEAIDRLAFCKTRLEAAKECSPSNIWGGQCDTTQAVLQECEEEVQEAEAEFQRALKRLRIERE